MRVDLRRWTFDAVNVNFDFFAAVADDDELLLLLLATLFSLLFSDEGRFRPIRLLATGGVASSGVICGVTSFNGFRSIVGLAFVVVVLVLLASLSSSSFLCSFLLALVHFSV